MMKKITDVPIRKFVMIKISYSHEFLQNSIQRRSATVPPCQVPIFVGSYTGKKTNRKMFISVNKAAAFRHRGSHLVTIETPGCRRHTWYREGGAALSPGCRQASTSGRLSKEFPVWYGKCDVRCTACRTDRVARFISKSTVYKKTMYRPLTSLGTT